jgi:hypothetical protein
VPLAPIHRKRLKWCEVFYFSWKLKKSEVVRADGHQKWKSEAMALNYFLSGDLYGRTRRTSENEIGASELPVSGPVQELKTEINGGFNPVLEP